MSWCVAKLPDSLSDAGGDGSLPRSLPIPSSLLLEHLPFSSTVLHLPNPYMFNVYGHHSLRFRSPSPLPFSIPDWPENETGVLVNVAYL